MRLHMCFIVCLTGCGLTLDLDEPVDASARDVSGIDARDSGTPVDAGELDAAVVDASIPDVGEGDGQVEPADVGIDAPSECAPSCGAGQVCLDEECWPLCGGEICFEGQVCDLELETCGACDPDMCPAGHVCGLDGDCVCAEGACSATEQCGPAGNCRETECNMPTDCVDPVGAGCVRFTCSMGSCASELIGTSSCEYCDPRTGDVHFFDRDRDGFAACPEGICEEGPEICDCDDGNPFINPESIDALGDRNCDGEFDPAFTADFCVSDEDEDDAPVVELVGSECSGVVLTARELLAAARRLPRLDCDDEDEDIFPQQMEYMSTSINDVSDCTASRGECFDYNCDGRHEREYPAFEQCYRVSTRLECNDTSGWSREARVPACGEMGELEDCRWSEESDACFRSDATTTTTQRCR
jgi:hypothetical protein